MRPLKVACEKALPRLYGPYLHQWSSPWQQTVSDDCREWAQGGLLNGVCGGGGGGALCIA